MQVSGRTLLQELSGISPGIPAGMREGSQGQAKRSPWNRAQNEDRVLEGGETTG